MPLNRPSKIEPDLPVIKALREAVRQYGHPAYLIGGYVRDLLLGRPCKDLDIVVVGDGVRLAEIFAALMGKDTRVTLFKNFGTAMVHCGEYDVEFVGARKESYQPHSRKPEVTQGSLEDDLSRRDFTINAMAIHLNEDHYGDFVDRFEGWEDLQKGILRTPLDPEITYSDDPLRMLRAIRFSAQLGFRIESRSLLAITSQKERIRIVSKERISDELNKIMAAPLPSAGFHLLADTGLLPEIFPALSRLQGVEYVQGKGHKDNFIHTLEVLDNVSKVSNDLWLRWAALLHDIAKPATKRFEEGHGWTFHGHEDKGARMVPAIFKELKLPLNEKMKYVQKLVLLHLRPIVLAKSEVTDSAVRRLLFEAGEEIDDLMTLCKADVTTKNEYKQKKYRSNFETVIRKLEEVEEKDRIRNWQPPVSGELIMQLFALRPGKEVGLLKNHIREAILDGHIGNDKEQALSLLLIKASELGLKPVKDFRKFFD